MNVTDFPELMQIPLNEGKMNVTDFPELIQIPLNAGKMNVTDFPQCFQNSSCNCSVLDFYDTSLLDNGTSNCLAGGMFASDVTYVVNVINYLCYSLTFVFGLLGNTLVIYVVSRFSKMQTPTNIYILNLALADELFLIGIPILITTLSQGSWIFGYVMCKIYMIITSLNQFTSSLFLAIMSADRYIAVCHPISSPKFRTTTISMFVSLTVWTVSALMITPLTLYASTVEFNSKENCNIFFPDIGHVTGNHVFTLYSFILAFAVPFLFIFIFYTLVILKLKTVGPENKSKEKRKSHRKVTKMVLKVIMVYLFCWLPYWVLQLTLIFTATSGGDIPHDSFKVFIFLISSLLSYLNSAVNPILYAFLSDNFKKSFIKATMCLFRGDVNSGLHPENSMFPRRQRKTSTKGHCTRIEGHSGEGGSSQTPCVSKEASTALTMTSRSMISQTNSPEDNVYKNSKGLLDVPNMHHAQF